MTLPFADASFDLVTAFEVIEHLQDGNQLLAEARRVLGPEGVLLVSTPNKAYYGETRVQSGPNPYHLHEFEFDDFSKTVTAVFPCSAVLLQNHIDAFAFYDPQTSRQIEGYFEVMSGGPAQAHFFLAVCSLHPLTSLHNFIYAPAATNLLRDREHHIELLKDELATARGERDTVMRMYDEQSDQLRQVVVDLKSKTMDLKTVVDALDAAENTVIERTQWAQRLDAELAASQEKLLHVQASRWVRLGRKLGLAPPIDQPQADPSKTDKDG